jgi:arginase
MAIVVLDAPSNLGLRMPAPGVVPGCYKLAGALRDNRLLDRVDATDAGVVVPPRYDISDWRPGHGVFNAAAIASYTRRLAGRIAQCLARDEFLIVLGGDCSIVLGVALALRRRGRYGLAFVDGHSDFRHPGNADHVGAAAGEDLALVTGRGQDDLTNLDGLRPYVRDADVALLGIRDADEAMDEVTGLGIVTASRSTVRDGGPAAAADRALRSFETLDGFWLHLDADVLDPAVMPAVDSPDPGGLEHEELVALLRPLLASPGCVGFDVTVFDPDLDPDGRLATGLTDTVVAAVAARS